MSAKRIPILFGTETGNAECCAEELAQAIEAIGYEAAAIDMEDYEPESLLHENIVLVVTSTHGNGDAPANAQGMLDYLRESDLSINHIKFAVCALGDSAFAYFAQCGKDFDEALGKLGGERIIDRVDCDDDYETKFAEFQSSVINYLKRQDS